MKLTKITLLLVVLSFSITVNSQKDLKTQSLSEGTIDNQFEYLIKKSNRYQEFKVVKLFWLNRLKKSVNDSLKMMRKELSTKEDIIVQKQSQIDKLTQTLKATNNNVSSLKKEKDSIKFFGASISKALYNIILWLIIILLLAALVSFILKFHNSNIITKETKEKFVELETEYEGHRQRSLEREQQLRRKLQDELNRQKKD